MKERPILFSGAMVRAILDGRKTQTRRIVKFQRGDDCFVMLDHGDCWWPFSSDDGETANVNGMEYPYSCPYGQPGDRLWVRETWGYNPDFPGMPGRACFRVDSGHEYDGIKWKPSIHMPRSACRIVLEITGVRVERLNDCSEDDARAEGVTIERHHKNGYCCGADRPPSLRAFRELWDDVNGAGAWAANPWVWVVEFRHV